MLHVSIHINDDDEAVKFQYAIDNGGTVQVVMDGETTTINNVEYLSHSTCKTPDICNIVE